MSGAPFSDIHANTIITLPEPSPEDALITVKSMEGDRDILILRRNGRVDVDLDETDEAARLLVDGIRRWGSLDPLPGHHIVLERSVGTFTEAACVCGQLLRSTHMQSIVGRFAEHLRRVRGESS